MNKIKFLTVFLVIFSCILLFFAFIKMKNREKMQEKILLAGEIRKALYYLMPDLGTARENRIKGVPADGEWHDRIVFDQTGQKFSEYFVKEGHLDEISGGKGFVIADHISGLRLRRQKQMPGILEMQIEAQSNVSLTFNLRIRIRQ